MEPHRSKSADPGGPPSAALLLAALLVTAATPGLGAATLPPHRPLRVMIVSDEVNPHGLPDDELTQPGDIGAALLAPGNGLSLDPATDAVVEVPTDEIERATALIALPRCDPRAYDVIIYFAHRIPMAGPSPQQRQDEFTAAVAAFVTAGGGLVSFHHGSYASAGKSGILDLIGGTASGAVPWNVSEGQNVIATAPAHFVAANGLAFTGTLGYADPARGVPAGTYSYFNNTPDERYPSFDLNPTAGETEVLFASDYNENGSTHLLGFTHHRPAWRGRVIAYQPGEYQPHALDDKDGNGFQVLANAIVWAAAATDPPPPPVALQAIKLGGGVRLSWSGGRPTYCVLRSADPAALGASWIDSLEASAWDDPAPPPGLLFFGIAGGR